MEGLLKFELPQETKEFIMASLSTQLTSSIKEFDEFLRKLIKYGHDFNCVSDSLNDIRNEFWRIMNSNSISEIVIYKSVNRYEDNL